MATDADKVKEVMAPGKDYDTVNNPSLTRFINMAGIFVARMVECATRKSFTHTAAELLEIETLLAAHFYQQSDKGYTSRSTAGASGSFQGRTDMALDSTLYGQTAKLLDGSGCLDILSKNNVAKVKWLGKTRSEQLSYNDRNG